MSRMKSSSSSTTRFTTQPTQSLAPEEMQDLAEIYSGNGLILPATEELCEYYCKLVSDTRQSLQRIFDSEHARDINHEPLLYLPTSCSNHVPSWGIVYYLWRRDAPEWFMDTIAETEEEVLGTSLLNEALSETDKTAYAISKSKYELLKAHYSNPSKRTVARNRAEMNALSKLSNEAIESLITAITSSTPASKPQPTLTPASTTLDITEADL